MSFIHSSRKLSTLLRKNWSGAHHVTFTCTFRWSLQSPLSHPVFLLRSPSPSPLHLSLSLFLFLSLSLTRIQGARFRPDSTTQLRSCSGDVINIHPKDHLFPYIALWQRCSIAEDATIRLVARFSSASTDPVDASAISRMGRRSGVSHTLP